MSRLSNSVRFSFGIGQMAEGINNSSFSAFLLFFYNQVLGLSAELASLAIAVSLIFDAVTDPMAGTISDRWKSPLGRRHPFMYASALPLGICFFFLFSPPPFATSGSSVLLFCWMLVFNLLTRAAMTLYHVPHMALGAELSTDYHERTILVAIRQFLSASGHLLVYGLGFGLFFAPTALFENGQLNADAYPPFAFCLAIVMSAVVWMSAYGTRSCIPHLPTASDAQTSTGIREMMAENLLVFKNRSFFWLLLGFIIIITAFVTATATKLYVFTFFWELSRFQLMVVLLTGPFGSMFGYAVASRLFARLDKRDAMITGAIMWMFFHSLPMALYGLGLMPDNGTWALTIILAIILSTLGASISQVLVGAGSTVADIADENELNTGSRQEGVLFGAASFGTKCTTAIGTLAAGFMLQVIDWPTGESIKSAADIPPDTLLTMAILSGPVAALLATPGVFCLMRYKLTRSKVTEIQTQLKLRLALET